MAWLSPLPVLIQESFWWWQCSNSYISFPSSPTPFSSSPWMVSVDVKHHVCLLTNTTRLCNHNLCTCTPWCGNSLLVSSLQTLQAHKQHNFHWTVFPFPLSSITNKILRVRAHATKQCHLPKDIIGTIRCKKEKEKKKISHLPSKVSQSAVHGCCPWTLILKVKGQSTQFALVIFTHLGHLWPQECNNWHKTE